MIRVLFVCHGNICRSPMAEFIMKDLAARRGVADRLQVESAATSAEELGNPVHPGTRAVLKAAGISCAGKTARQVRPADARAWDLIVGMDQANMRNLRRMLGPDADGKLFKLLEFAGLERDVADPWYTGDFEATYDDVRAGCEGLLSYLHL